MFYHLFTKYAILSTTIQWNDCHALIECNKKKLQQKLLQVYHFLHILYFLPADTKMRSKISSRWAQMLPHLGRLEIKLNNRTNKIKQAFFWEGNAEKEPLNKAKNSSYTQWTKCVTHWWDDSATHWWDESALTTLLVSLLRQVYRWNLTRVSRSSWSSCPFVWLPFALL